MPSFDIVSKLQWNEVDNALNQAGKELAQRYDFKGTETEVEKLPEGISIRSASEDRVKAAWSVVQEKLVKRKVSLKFFEEGKIEPTGKGGAKTLVKIKEGIEGEQAKGARPQDQGLEAQGPSRDPGCAGARDGEEQGRPAGRHSARARRRLLLRDAVHQLPRLTNR